MWAASRLMLLLWNIDALWKHELMRECTRILKLPKRLPITNEGKVLVTFPQ